MSWDKGVTGDLMGGEKGGRRLSSPGSPPWPRASRCDGLGQSSGATETWPLRGPSGWGGPSSSWGGWRGRAGAPGLGPWGDAGALGDPLGGHRGTAQVSWVFCRDGGIWSFRTRGAGHGRGPKGGLWGCGVMPNPWGPDGPSRGGFGTGRAGGIGRRSPWKGGWRGFMGALGGGESGGPPAASLADPPGPAGPPFPGSWESPGPAPGKPEGLFRSVGPPHGGVVAGHRRGGLGFPPVPTHASLPSCTGF
jgi:hypothetical protein